MAVTFAPLRSAPSEPYEPAEPDPALSPEVALWNAVATAVRELTQFGDRIAGGVSRTDDYRVGPADLARARRVFNEGLEALGRYQHRRKGGAS